MCLPLNACVYSVFIQACFCQIMLRLMNDTCELVKACHSILCHNTNSTNNILYHYTNSTDYSTKRISKCENS